MRRFFFVPGHFDKNRTRVFKSLIQAQEKVQAIPGVFELVHRFKHVSPATPAVLDIS
jgi:hypothetical protein